MVNPKLRSAFTLEPFSPPSWSLSLRPHTNILTCPSGVDSVVVGFLLSALLCLAASSSSSNARNEKLAAMSSSSVLVRAVRLMPWILQSIPLLLHCRIPISRKRYSYREKNNQINWGKTTAILIMINIMTMKIFNDNDTYNNHDQDNYHDHNDDRVTVMMMQTK